MFGVVSSACVLMCFRALALLNFDPTLRIPVLSFQQTGIRVFTPSLLIVLMTLFLFHKLPPFSCSVISPNKELLHTTLQGDEFVEGSSCRRWDNQHRAWRRIAMAIIMSLHSLFPGTSRLSLVTSLWEEFSKSVAMNKVRMKQDKYLIKVQLRQKFVFTSK